MDSEVQQVLKNSYNRSSLKHGMFSWSRHTSAFRSRSQYASQTSVSYCGNNTFPLETHRLRSDPATPTLSREIELNKVIHKGSPVLNAEAYNVNNDSSRLTSTNCSIDLLNQQKTSGNNRKQPRTTLFKSGNQHAHWARKTILISASTRFFKEEIVQVPSAQCWQTVPPVGIVQHNL